MRIRNGFLWMLCPLLLLCTACAQTPAASVSTPVSDGAPASPDASTAAGSKKSVKSTRTAAQTQEEDAAVPTAQKTTKSLKTRASRTAKATTAGTTGAATGRTVRPAKPTVKKVYPADRIKVACVGDSITKNGYWENRLQGFLSTRYAVAGYGVNGATCLYSGTDNDTTQIAYVRQSEYSSSMNYEPDIVVIMLGTNDSKPFNWQQRFNKDGVAFIDDYTDLVRSYQQLDSAPTVFLALPPTVFKDFAKINNMIIEKEIIPAIRKVAANTGAIIIDTHAANANAHAQFTDGVHPSSLEGKRILAKPIADAIKQAVGAA